MHQELLNTINTHLHPIVQMEPKSPNISSWQIKMKIVRITNSYTTKTWPSSKKYSIHWTFFYIIPLPSFIYTYIHTQFRNTQQFFLLFLSEWEIYADFFLLSLTFGLSIILVLLFFTGDGELLRLSKIKKLDSREVGEKGGFGEKHGVKEHLTWN